MIQPADAHSTRATGRTDATLLDLVRRDPADIGAFDDRALAALSPRVREVIVARFIDGESAAQIGKQHVRTEQTVTAWLRQGIAELRVLLGAWAA